MKPSLRWSLLLLSGLIVGGCGTPDATVVDSGPNFGSTIPMDAPVLLGASDPPCSEPHTVCMTVKMPDTIPGTAL